jgi:protocatechuate 3,4-dioxygenase beta subunit
MKNQTSLNRREFLRASIASAVSFLLAACGLRPAGTATQPAAPATTAEPPTLAPPTEAASTQPAAASPAPTQPAPTEAAQGILPPTPACGDEDDVTPAQTEGPYYTPDTPERASFLEPGITGTRMVVTGYVLSTRCEPVARALLDFWHCDDAGVYDNVGYKLRGHFFSDDQGRYTLETIMPGLYPGRTRHFHVKVQAPNQPILTTQLYFPGEAGNQSDGIFNSDLLMEVQDAEDGKLGAFNFVLDLG